MQHSIYRNLRRKAAVLIAAVAIAACTGCAGRQNTDPGEAAEAADPNELQTKELFAMDTYMSLTAYGEDAEAALEEAAAEITRLDEMLAADVKTFAPDLVVSDSACFWGKLMAGKYALPMVCSTTTFAFNRYSSQYMKYSAAEMADMVLGLPRLNRAMRKLRPLGYKVKSALEIVQNANDTDTIVYTSARFQPCADSFDAAHYRFVGPSLRAPQPREKTGRPLIYISLGTVINNHPDFYRRCLEALAAEDVEVLISCGRAFDPEQLGTLPANARVMPYVDQLDVLAGASLFITHCGMNSASEGLYMGVPELLFPLTGEQQAVARRVQEMSAGRLLTPKEADDPAAIRRAIREALADGKLRDAAAAMRADFLACGGPKEAADFIEQAGRKE